MVEEKPIIKKIKIPKDTKPSDFYYNDKAGALVFEPNKRKKK